MTDTDTDATAEAPDAETGPEPDAARDELVEDLRSALGEVLVGQHVEPHRDVWIRVDRSGWQTVGRTLKEMGFTYFGFLSAIDWMDAPDGRYESTEFDDAGTVPADADADEAGDGDGADEDGADDGADGDGDGADEDGADDGADGDGADGDEAAAVERLAGGDTRFQVFARLQRPGTALGVTIKADLPDDDLSIDSWIDVYAGANWHEREAHEMFGIDFVGHHYLRHIYLPTEFEGHPLRKDYPLLARVVKPWPGVVDIEEIPEHLEQQLEDEVMAAFNAEQGEEA